MPSINIKSEGLIWLFSAIAVMVFRLLFMTIRTEFHLAEESANPYRKSDQTFTYCVWHDSLLIPVFVGRQPATIAIVGQHKMYVRVGKSQTSKGFDNMPSLRLGCF